MVHNDWITTTVAVISYLVSSAIVCQINEIQQFEYISFMTHSFIMEGILNFNNSFEQI